MIDFLFGFGLGMIVAALMIHFGEAADAWRGKAGK